MTKVMRTLTCRTKSQDSTFRHETFPIHLFRHIHNNCLRAHFPQKTTRLTLMDWLWRKASERKNQHIPLHRTDECWTKSHRNLLSSLHLFRAGGGENHFTVIIILYHDLCTRIHHKALRSLAGPPHFSSDSSTYKEARRARGQQQNYCKSRRETFMMYIEVVHCWWGLVLKKT